MMRIFDKIRLFFKKDIKIPKIYYCLDIFEFLKHSCCDESHIEEGLYKKTGRQIQDKFTKDIFVEVVPTLKFYKENKLYLLKKIDNLKDEISKLEKY